MDYSQAPYQVVTSHLSTDQSVHAEFKFYASLECHPSYCKYIYLLLSSLQWMDVSALPVPLWTTISSTHLVVVQIQAGRLIKHLGADHYTEFMHFVGKAEVPVASIEATEQTTRGSRVEKAFYSKVGFYKCRDPSMVHSTTYLRCSEILFMKCSSSLRNIQDY